MYIEKDIHLKGLSMSTAISYPHGEPVAWSGPKRCNHCTCPSFLARETVISQGFGVYNQNYPKLAQQMKETTHEMRPGLVFKHHSSTRKTQPDHKNRHVLIYVGTVRKFQMPSEIICSMSIRCSTLVQSPHAWLD